MAPFDLSVIMTRFRPLSRRILPASSADRSSVIVIPVSISAWDASGVSMDID